MTDTLQPMAVGVDALKLPPEAPACRDDIAGMEATFRPERIVCEPDDVGAVSKDEALSQGGAGLEYLAGYYEFVNDIVVEGDLRPDVPNGTGGAIIVARAAE